VTFAEMPLYGAIHDVFRIVESPGSDNWLRPPASEEVCRLIQAHLPLDSSFSSRQMLDAWMLYRKAPSINEALKKVELLVLIGRVHGTKCFFAHRDKGECSIEVSIDRIVPGSRGGRYTVENCMIVCSFHNSQRSNRFIEEYLKCESHKNAPSAAPYGAADRKD